MNVPSGYTALGLIGFTDQGVYNSVTAYVRNDIVHYNGNLWRCLVDDTTAVTPAEGANWTVYLAEPTSAAEDIIAPVEATATSTHIYTVGKQLILADVLYDVIDPINIGDALVVGTNISPANTIVEQLADKADSADLATVATSGAYSDLSGQPTLGTAAAKNVPASGDASTTEVVMGNDTRLTNARNAADVSAWAKAANKPTYNGSEIKTSTAKTGTAQQSISDTVASGTSMDNVVGTMLDNDKTLDTNVTSLKETLSDYQEVCGSKNLFDSYISTVTNYGVTLTKNADGSISYSGQALSIPFGYRIGTIKLKAGQTYKLTGAVDNNHYLNLFKTGVFNIYDRGSGATVTITEDLEAILSVVINDSAVLSGTFYPMVRLANIGDDTFEPYVPTNSQLLSYKDNGVLGAKNLLNNIAATQVLNGVTFTKNSNGSVTISGTATSTFSFHLNDETRLDAGTYIFSNGNVASPICFLRNAQESVNVCELTDGREKSFSLGSSTTLQANVYIVSGTTYNTTIYPMIRLASDTDPTYQPYAKSNKELTDELAVKVGTATGVSGSVFYLNELDVRQYGRVVTINGYAEHITAAADTVTQIGTISGISLPIKEIRAIGGVAAHAYNAPTKIAYINISSSTGNIFVRCTEALNDQSIYFSISYIV